MNTNLWLALALLLVPFSAKPSPNIAVSITPFYALVAAIIKNTDTPEPILLVKPGASPHQYALRPSDLQALNQADIVFWAGPEYETFLKRPLDNLKAERPHLKVITFESTPHLIRLPMRQGVNWELEHDHHHHHGDMDMHFWLDPENAILMAETIVQQLSLLDPAQASHYQQNGKELRVALQALNHWLNAQLKPFRNIPFIVFHDAYQYFQHRYGLNIVGSITIHPEAPPSAKRIAEIRSTIFKTKAKCVFSEPQFQPKLVESLIDDLNIHSGELDPIGNEDEKNADGYFMLLNRLANSMTQCLKNP